MYLANTYYSYTAEKPSAQHTLALSILKNKKKPILLSFHAVILLVFDVVFRISIRLTPSYDDIINFTSTTIKFFPFSFFPAASPRRVYVRRTYVFMQSIIFVIQKFAIRYFTGYAADALARLDRGGQIRVKDCPTYITII